MNFIIAIGSVFITIFTIIILTFMPLKESDITSLPYFKSLIGLAGFVFFIVCSKLFANILQRGDANDG